MAMTCGVEDVSVYYFFSTCAQAIAATTSLSGAMLIFRYQSLYQLVADGAQGVATEFRRSPVAKIVPWEGNDHADFTRRTTFIGKTNVLRRYFSNEAAPARRKQFVERLEAAKVDVKTNIQHYEGLRHLFNQYEVRVRAATRLRRLTIVSTLLGLVLVLAGSLFVLSPGMQSSTPLLCDAWYGYVGALTVYLVFTIYVTAVAFTNPLSEH